MNLKEHKGRGGGIQNMWKSMSSRFYLYSNVTAWPTQGYP